MIISIEVLLFHYIKSEKFIKSEKIKKWFPLFLVFGERAKTTNIEINDVISVVGSEIEDTKDNLKRNWFLFLKVLHIDRCKNIYRWL